MRCWGAESPDFSAGFLQGRVVAGGAAESGTSSGGGMRTRQLCELGGGEQADRLDNTCPLVAAVACGSRGGGARRRPEKPRMTLVGPSCQWESVHGRRDRTTALLAAGTQRPSRWTRESQSTIESPRRYRGLACRKLNNETPHRRVTP